MKTTADQRLSGCRASKSNFKCFTLSSDFVAKRNKNSRTLLQRCHLIGSNMFDQQQRKNFQAARMARDPRFDGLFYIAVKTTGIFCRPICPANSPKEANVEYYPNREQAILAGFRPCLRCRPDSAPGSFAWKGVETTVERGLKLLREHPNLSIADISEKLGISERYLHQLLKQHLGISAKQYQLYSQVLFAKQLLHQTHLSVEDVAHSVGFNSSRRLQAQIKAITGLSPKQIRNRNTLKSTDRITLLLNYRPPYNWAVLRDFLAMRAIEPVEKVTESSYSRFFNLDDDKANGYFEAEHQPQINAFKVSIQLNKPQALQAVVHQIRRVLDLDAQPLAITQGLEDTGLNPECLTQGLRLPGVWSPFEAGCRAIVGQQISVKGAIKQLQLIVDHAYQDSQLSGFPTPQCIMTLDPSILRMPQARKDTLKRFAQCFCENPQPSVDELLEIKGIGPWTVNYIRLRGLSEPDLLLHNDLIVANQLKAHTIAPTAASPWRSYLTLQLWQLSTQSKSLK